MNMTNQKITVNGGYQPAIVTVKQGKPATLTFQRTQDQGCLARVHSKALDFDMDLPLNAPQTVTIPTDQAGEFDFSCGMDMFYGKVVVQP
nr:cupredoxin domain-containing protein [Lactiplantibacillus daowaiensis]